MKRVGRIRRLLRALPWAVRGAYTVARKLPKEQRQELIEQRRQEIHEKAKAMGYKVKETKESGQVRLVLVRRG